MKFIQPSYELWYPTEPLKDIERAARISYASEGQITETSSKPLVDKLFTREHMTPFEFVTFKFGTYRTDLVDRYLWINQWPSVQGDLIFLKHDDLYEGSCNLRTAILLNQYDTELTKFIIDKYPELISYFENTKFKNNKGLQETFNDYQINSNFDHCIQYQTVKFVTNRGVSHELVRHRKAGFVQSSTRYIGYEKEQFNGELPIVSNQGFVNQEITEENFDIQNTYHTCLLRYEDSYKSFREVKKSPGEARAILPNDTMTEIVMITRHWSWKHFFKLRIASGAHPDMQALVKPCYEEFKSKWPEYYND